MFYFLEKRYKKQMYVTKRLGKVYNLLPVTPVPVYLHTNINRTQQIYRDRKCYEPRRPRITWTTRNRPVHKNILLSEVVTTFVSILSRFE